MSQKEIYSTLVDEMEVPEFTIENMVGEGWTLQAIYDYYKEAGW